MTTTRIAAIRITAGQTVICQGETFTIIENRLGACGDRFLVTDTEGNGLAFNNEIPVTVIV
jgi:hypothetical protein